MCTCLRKERTMSERRTMEGKISAAAEEIIVQAQIIVSSIADAVACLLVSKTM